MSSLDQFASVFNAAAKLVYQHAEVEINKVLVVTDLEESQAKLYQQSIRNFLSIERRPRLRDRCFAELSSIKFRHLPVQLYDNWEHQDE